MVLCHPITGNPFGVIDLDVTDYDPSEVKAKLTDGSFVVIGKLTKQVSADGQLSLVQRTFLSYIMKVLETLMGVTPDVTALTDYKNGINTAKPLVEKFCRLSINGPAYRMAAMSVCA